MKTLFYLLFLSLFFSVAEAKNVHVKGYTKKNGTYVAPHDRSSPNHTKSDNYSTKGNVNPYTGKAGTQSAEGASSASSSSTSSESTVRSDKPTANHLNWDKVKPGMTKAIVSSIMGEPNIKTDSKWVYSDLGTVSFTSSGLSQ